MAQQTFLLIGCAWYVVALDALCDLARPTVQIPHLIDLSARFSSLVWRRYPAVVHVFMVRLLTCSLHALFSSLGCVVALFLCLASLDS